MLDWSASLQYELALTDRFPATQDAISIAPFRESVIEDRKQAEQLEIRLPPSARFKTVLDQPPAGFTTDGLLMRNCWQACRREVPLAEVRATGVQSVAGRTLLLGWLDSGVIQKHA